MKQVDKKNYNFKRYCGIDRWSSYWYQLNEILSLAPLTVLEAGVGDKVVGNYLRTNSEIKYECLDVDPELEPDAIGSIEAIPFSDHSFDVVCAFQVLEHLPFDRFENTLGEMSRVSKKHILISLPHWGRHFSIKIRLPYFKQFSWQCKLNLFPIKHVFQGQHYWEIGKCGFPLKLIRRKIASAGLKILKDYVAFEMPYHHFFVLEKNNHDH